MTVSGQQTTTNLCNYVNSEFAHQISGTTGGKSSKNSSLHLWITTFRCTCS